MAPPTTADSGPSLTLGPRAFDIRRAVGPIAWAVLECLAAHSVESAGETMSQESVRGIADSLGLAKDTVARAVRRLAAQQLVGYVAGREHDGRFGPSYYRLTLPSDLFVTRHTYSTSVPLDPVRHSRRPRPGQLSLLDAIAAHNG